MQNTILETYINNGFEHIITPAIEDAENLDKSEGGENLNLIFKILKRGDKLAKAIEEKNYDSLSDMGLRYDLTLPLSRYYANNRANLILPVQLILHVRLNLYILLPKRFLQLILMNFV